MNVVLADISFANGFYQFNGLYIMRANGFVNLRTGMNYVQYELKNGNEAWVHSLVKCTDLSH